MKPREYRRIPAPQRPLAPPLMYECGHIGQTVRVVCGTDEHGPWRVRARLCEGCARSIDNSPTDPRYIAVEAYQLA